jgi:hypothetical protein
MGYKSMSGVTQLVFFGFEIEQTFCVVLVFQVFMEVCVFTMILIMFGFLCVQVSNILVCM